MLLHASDQTEGSVETGGGKGVGWAGELLEQAAGGVHGPARFGGEFLGDSARALERRGRVRMQLADEPEAKGVVGSKEAGV